MIRSHALKLPWIFDLGYLASMSGGWVYAYHLSGMGLCRRLQAHA